MQFIKDTITKFVAQFPTQLSVGGLERKREKHDRNIHVRNRRKNGPSPYAIKKAKGMPMELLPNVRTFKISLSTYDFIFKLFGIDRKHKPIIEIEPLSKTNYQMNRYVVYQFQRMDRHQKKGEIGKILIKRSYSFRLMALRQVYPDWGRSTPFSLILSLLGKVATLASTEAHEIDFKRTYIPKANGKLRPLGVPTMAGRIYLHQWQCITYGNCRHIISKSQHGFQPGKGVLTAGRQILQEVIQMPNIYEFDLKGFFDNVDGVMVQRGLIGAGAPQWVQDYFRLINCSRPQIQEALLPERSLEREAYDKWHNELADLADIEFATNLNWHIKPGQPARSQHIELQGYPAEEGYFHKIDDDGFVNEEEIMKAYWFQSSPAEKEHNRRIEEEYTRGVPQGSGLSPILAILALEPEFMPKVTVQYADDGLIASPTPQELNLDLYTNRGGIEEAKEKSGYVKREGKWLKPLKFLGMEYDGLTETFRASTRNGATLEFSGKENVLLQLDKALLNMKLSDFVPLTGSAQGIKLNAASFPMENMMERASGRSLLGSEFYGLFFNRMQCDSGNIILEQDFSLNGEKFEKHSGLGNKDVEALGPLLGEIPFSKPVKNGKGWQFLGMDTRPVVRWAWLKLKEWGVVKVNLFNASSYAYHDLARILRKRSLKLK